jgi:hypothetical protein
MGRGRLEVIPDSAVITTSGGPLGLAADASVGAANSAAVAAL